MYKYRLDLQSEFFFFLFFFFLFFSSGCNFLLVCRHNSTFLFFLDFAFFCLCYRGKETLEEAFIKEIFYGFFFVGTI